MFKLQRFVLAEKLPLHFSETLDSPIWEMHQSGDFILMATRDEEKLEVSFSLFDLQAGAFLWKHILFEESWWIGITHFHEGMIAFHTFEGDQSFEKKSLFGFEIRDQEVVWVLEGYQPLETEGQSIFCIQTGDQNRQPYRLDLKSGQIESFESKTFDVSESISIHSHHPLHYVEGTAAFDSVSRYLSVIMSAEPFGACDYLEHKDRTIVSFFEKQNDTINNQLVIFDNEGNVIYQELIDSDLKGLASDTFFIAGEALIFVKNRNQLIGLTISG